MKLILFILVFAITSFASTCQELYNRMQKTLPTQKVTICRVTGIGEDKTDVLGMFFHFAIADEQYPAVFLYGNDYPEMLYSGEDWIVKHATCIENEYFRSIKTKMTAEQILDKLFSYKHCEPDFKKKEGSHGKLYI